jgi:hypothetical protein
MSRKSWISSNSRQPLSPELLFLLKGSKAWAGGSRPKIGDVYGVTFRALHFGEERQKLIVGKGFAWLWFVVGDGEV